MLWIIFIRAAWLKLYKHTTIFFSNKNIVRKMCKCMKNVLLKKSCVYCTTVRVVCMNHEVVVLHSLTETTLGLDYSDYC